MDEKSKEVISAKAHGAVFQTTYVSRSVNAYPLHDSDIESLSLFNNLSTLFFNFCSFLLALALGIWTNAAFVERPTAEGQILAWVAAPIMIFFSVVFLGWAIWAHVKRKTIWSEIRKTAK